MGLNVLVSFHTLQEEVNEILPLPLFVVVVVVRVSIRCINVVNGAVGRKELVLTFGVKPRGL